MILYKDRLVEASDVTISPLDRGYYFGDGIYEVIRIYNGKFFEKEAHLRRLVRSSEHTRIPLPYSLPQLEDMLDRLLTAEGVMTGSLYMQITRGEAPRVHQFPNPPAQPVLYATCSEWRRPLESFRNGISAITSPDIRWLRCDLKTLNLLPNVLARQEAAEQGAGEAIFQRNGIVTDCSSSNVMIVKNGALWTHPADNFILHGITREVVLKLARKLEIPVHEEPFTLEKLLTADEAFITSTSAEVTPVVKLDGRAVGDGTPGPVSRKLQQAFDAYIGE